MDDIGFIKEVETTLNLQSIKVDQMQVWPIVRARYYLNFAEKNSYNKKLVPKASSWKIFLIRFLNSIPSLFHFFKKYDYIIISDSREIRGFDGKYTNKLFQTLISVLGTKKTLLLEMTVSGEPLLLAHRSTGHFMAMDLLTTLSILPVFKRKPQISTDKLLRIINKKYNLNVNYKALVSSFIRYNNVFRLIYWLHRPRALFLNTYYELICQAAVFAANNKNIPTIEFQHGDISNKHSAYNLFSEFDANFFPKYLFTFGKVNSSTFNIFNTSNYFIKSKNIFSVGSNFLDYYIKKYVPSVKTQNFFESLRKKYQKLTVISAQWTIEPELIVFLKKSALLDKSILYIYVPRDISKDYSRENFPENMIILKGLNLYQIACEVNLHITVYSTFALEAPILGIPNILIDIKDFSKLAYSQRLTDHDVTRFVNTEEELVSLINSWDILPKETIRKKFDTFYTPNHEENLVNVLKKLKLIENKNIS